MVSDTIDINNEKVINNLDLNIQETILFKSLENFYQDKQNYKILLSIVEGDDLVSRRTIEYFVTKYSYLNNISYDLIDCNNNKTKFEVYSSYKNKLKSHKKKYFDPFGRGDRIPFFTLNNCIITTIGQLNFYKWFISNNIYEYCYNNYDKIQKSLIQKSSIAKKRNKKNNKPNNILMNNHIIQSYDYSSNSLSVSFDL